MTLNSSDEDSRQAEPPAREKADGSAKAGGHGWMGRALREPLVHFVVLGILIFGGYKLADRQPQAGTSLRIEIGADDIRQIVIAWLAQGRLPLTPDQLQSLIDQKIAEEVLYREGLALGLDRNDEIIKRRIAQKMDFLAADVAAVQEPGKAELKEWFSRHSARFALAPRASFRHLYFSPDKRGAAARDDAEAALVALARQTAGSEEAAAMADPFMLRGQYRDSTPDFLLREFGPAFSRKLFELKPGGWRGPVQSGLGWHLVWIEAIKPGRIPAFEEVEADVRAAWRDARYKEIKRAAIDEMRSRYEIVVPPLEDIDFDNLGIAPPGQAKPVPN